MQRKSDTEMWFVISGIAILVTIAVFHRSERNRGKEVFQEAVTRESKGDWAGACYFFGIALDAGYQQSNCAARIRALWNEYGPFKFSEQLAESVQQYCRYESCGQGFHELTVDRIRAIVGEKSKPA